MNAWLKKWYQRYNATLYDFYLLLTALGSFAEYDEISIQSHFGHSFNCVIYDGAICRSDSPRDSSFSRA